MRLTRSFFSRDAESLARALLGQRLVRVLNGERLAGTIVETEAYLGVEDRAAHSYGGRRTARTASMYLDAGHAYVYFIYGVHYCMNVTAAAVDDPAAVLLRALEPVEGLERMRMNRGLMPQAGPPAAKPSGRGDTNLCSGPGKLCQALGIDRALDGADLTTGETLFIERGSVAREKSPAIVATTRIGVAYAGEWARRPLRFYLAGHPHISRK